MPDTCNLVGNPIEESIQCEPGLPLIPVTKFDTGAVRGTDANGERYDLLSNIAMRVLTNVEKDSDTDLEEVSAEPIDHVETARSYIDEYVSGETEDFDMLVSAAFEALVACHLHHGGSLYYLGALPPRGVAGYARAMAEGVSKYPVRNWEKGIPTHDLLNHALKHFNKYSDNDESEDHLGHAVWNLMSAIHLRVTKPEGSHGMKWHGKDREPSNFDVYLDDEFSPIEVDHDPTSDVQVLSKYNFAGFVPPSPYERDPYSSGIMVSVHAPTRPGKPFSIPPRWKFVDAIEVSVPPTHPYPTGRVALPIYFDPRHGIWIVRATLPDSSGTRVLQPKGWEPAYDQETGTAFWVRHSSPDQDAEDDAIEGGGEVAVAERHLKVFTLSQKPVFTPLYVDVLGNEYIGTEFEGEEIYHPGEGWREDPAIQVYHRCRPGQEGKIRRRLPFPLGRERVNHWVDPSTIPYLRDNIWKDGWRAPDGGIYTDASTPLKAEEAGPTDEEIVAKIPRASLNCRPLDFRRWVLAEEVDKGYVQVPRSWTKVTKDTVNFGGPYYLEPPKFKE